MVKRKLDSASKIENAKSRPVVRVEYPGEGEVIAQNLAE